LSLAIVPLRSAPLPARGLSTSLMRHAPTLRRFPLPQ
jgi:hypothetical protein